MFHFIKQKKLFHLIIQIEIFTHRDLMSLSYSSKSMAKVLSLLKKLLSLALQSLNEIDDDYDLSKHIKNNHKTSNTMTSIVKRTHRKLINNKTLKMKKQAQNFFYSKCFSFQTKYHCCSNCSCLACRCFNEINKCSKCVIIDVKFNNKISSSFYSNQIDKEKGKHVASSFNLSYFFKLNDRHIANFCLVIFISTIFFLYLHPLED
jgi:hypothetical protein